MQSHESYLWIVLSIASMQCNGLEIEATIKVDCCNDVSFPRKLTSADHRATKDGYSLQSGHDTTHSSTRSSTGGLWSL